MGISTGCRDLITLADIVSSVALMCLCVGLSSSYWYEDGDTHVGLWEWHLCEYISVCMWMVLTNNTYVVMKLMIAGITFSILSTFLLALALQNDVYATFNLVSAGVSLLFSGLCTAFAAAIYAAGLRLLSTARIVYSDHFGYSFYATVLGTLLSLVASAIALTTVCVLSRHPVSQRR